MPSAEKASFNSVTTPAANGELTPIWRSNVVVDKHQAVEQGVAVTSVGPQ